MGGGGEGIFVVEFETYAPLAPLLPTKIYIPNRCKKIPDAKGGRIRARSHGPDGEMLATIVTPPIILVCSLPVP